MKVKLLEEWMGTPKSSVIDIIPYFAKSLIERKVAVEVEDNSPSQKLMRRQKDKMIHLSEDK